VFIETKLEAVNCLDERRESYLQVWETTKVTGSLVLHGMDMKTENDQE